MSLLHCCCCCCYCHHGYHCHFCCSAAAAIIAAAINLFRDKGWAATTLPMIAGEAGTAVDTIYSTFGREGRAPSPAELAAAHGLSSDVVTAALIPRGQHTRTH